MQLHLHQTHQTIADFSAIFSYLKDYFQNEPPSGIHLFPELFLTGYPLQDLCLQKQFIDNYHQFLKDLNEWCLKEIKGSEEIIILMGGLKYNMTPERLPITIENVIFQLIPGKEPEAIYSKQLLPNYDIFDEKKYFTPGTESKIIEFKGYNIALMICEDMWPSTSHSHDPIQTLANKIEKENIQLDLIVNLSASPFRIGMEESRLNRAMEISTLLDAPFAYANRVGGEDEILFDGVSFVVNKEKILGKGEIFSKDLITIDIDKANLNQSPDELWRINPKTTSVATINTWESLFRPNLNPTGPDKLPTIPPLTDEECEKILSAIKFGVGEYAKKCGFNKFVVALSGGIDSSLVLAIMHIVKEEGQELEAIFMPGLYSASLSYDLSYELASNLGVKLTNLPIKFFHSTIRNSFGDNFSQEMDGIADENIQSRLRGALLYARSNQTGALVLNTSNKSELAVGYSTLYGDSVGAISILGDLYKSEIFTLSKYINKMFNNIIPEKIILRPPTAELKADQLDSDQLPPYERLDPILEGILSYRISVQELIEMGFDQAEVKNVYRLYQNSEFKRTQFGPIIKLKAKSFGFGYRVPICKSIEF